MRINKKIMLVCAICILLSGVANCLINNNKIQNITSGIFTGFIVSLIVSTINYFYEKAVIIEKTDSNLKALYINMNVLSKIIGNMLPYIFNAERMESLPFGRISELSRLNIDFSEKMDLGLFSPIRKKGKLVWIYTKLFEFQQTLYNIRNISLDLQIQSMEFTNIISELQNNQLKGIPLSNEDNENINKLRNLINIRTAKFHEYITGKTLELEKIAESFYNRKKMKTDWQTIKDNLTRQIEDLVKR